VIRDYCTNDKRAIAQQLQRLDTHYRAAIQLLGKPAWSDKRKVAEVVKRRIALSWQCDILYDMISDGWLDAFIFTTDEPDPAQLEKLITPLRERKPGWDDFDYALRRGDEKEMAGLTRQLKSSDMPQETLHLLGDHFEGKIKRNPGHQPGEGRFRYLQHRPRKAAEYYEEAWPELKAMYYPEQKLKVIKERALELAADEYKTDVRSVRTFKSRSKKSPQRTFEDGLQVEEK
jgi:hypothetical protein